MMIEIFNLTYFGNTLLQYLIFFGITIGSIIIGKLFFFISKTIIRVKAEKTKTQLDDILVNVLEKPLVVLVFILGFSFAVNTLSLGPKGIDFFANTISILWTIDIAWIVITFVDALILNYIQPITAKTKSDLDDALVPLIRKLVKTVLIIIAAIIVIDRFGYNVSSLLAGLGIGGLAFALAAKDMLANLFGGFAIITDKPFKLGDRIKVEGHDGWVREIGLRTTKVETLDGFLMIVPNSKIADSILENVSKEKARKVKMTIGVEYATSSKKMEQAKKILKDIIKKNTLTKDESIVGFSEFADSSLNILTIYWIKDLNNIITIKDQINTEIKKQFEKAKIEMAFPSRTIYLKK